jgi:virulence-associated protein VapD
LILDLTIFVKDSSSVSEVWPFKEYPLQKYLTRHKINNIRVISRIINALNDFSFIESGIKDVPEVTTEIVP